MPKQEPRDAEDDDDGKKERDRKNIVPEQAGHEADLVPADVAVEKLLVRVDPALREERITHTRKERGEAEIEM